MFEKTFLSIILGYWFWFCKHGCVSVCVILQRSLDSLDYLELAKQLTFGEEKVNLLRLLEFVARYTTQCSIVFNRLWCGQPLLEYIELVSIILAEMLARCLKKGPQYGNWWYSEGAQIEPLASSLDDWMYWPQYITSPALARLSDQYQLSQTFDWVTSLKNAMLIHVMPIRC